jgi:chitinase
MARNVIYVNNINNQIPLAGIANLPYTDVILTFLYPNNNFDLVGAGPVFDPNLEPNLQSDIQALQNAGKHVLISFGGAQSPGDLLSQAYLYYAADQGGRKVQRLVQQIVNFVTMYGLDGVDIDYEDNAGFQGAYNGIAFLNALTSGLATGLPPGRNIITHAPQTAYWDASGAIFQWRTGGIAPYVRVWQTVGGKIAWINNQFYNTQYYDKDAATKVQWYNNIAAITGPQKLLIGALLSTKGGGEGVITLADMVQNVITPLKAAYGAQFGGVMSWQFSFDQGGNWANGIWQALVAGSPVPVPRPPPPPTVDPEIVYLCNCYLSDGQKSSEMNYYPKTSLSQHGERPAATAVVATDGTVTWEGHPVVGTFPDGDHFTSNITDHNGPVGAVKGSGLQRLSPVHMPPR